MLIDIFISTIINGSVYALLALGFSLIFGVARIVNIAHTAFYMVAAFFIHMMIFKLGLNVFVSMLISVVIVTIIGLICYKLVVEPIREQEAAVLISTIALALIFQELMTLSFGSEFMSVPAFIDGFTKILGVKVTYQQIITFIAAILVLTVTWVFLLKTKFGLAIRATAQDREVANLMGMNEAKIALITMGASIGLAAFTGAVVVPLTILHSHMWLSPLVMMMAVVILGGLGSIKGSFIGAFILALVESLVVFILPGGAFLKLSVALFVMILVLLIRPEGLLGVGFEEER